MIENNPSDVVAAVLDMLLEDVEAEIEFVNQVGARAFERRDYEKAKAALERAAQVMGFRDKADILRREWETLSAQEEDDEDTEAHTERRNLGRLQRGLRTREDVYYRPILQVLEDLGGSGQVSEVLDRVHRNMKGILREVDYEPLSSDPEMPRWRNTAHWARNTMVKEG